MSHASTYGDGVTATANECMKDALRNAHWEYQQGGGTLNYKEWCATANEAKRIYEHYQGKD